jgi:hypothetical protein
MYLGTTPSVISTLPPYPLPRALPYASIFSLPGPTTYPNSRIRYIGSPSYVLPNSGNACCFVQSTSGNNNSPASTNTSTRSLGMTRERTLLQQLKRSATMLASNRSVERGGLSLKMMEGARRMLTLACSMGVVAASTASLWRWSILRFNGSPDA